MMSLLTETCDRCGAAVEDMPAHRKVCPPHTIGEQQLDAEWAELQARAEITEKREELREAQKRLGR